MMVNRPVMGFLVLLMLLALNSGCGSSPPPSAHLRRISMGMSQHQVLEELGEPRVVRGAIQNQYDQTIEVWEYLFALPADDSGAEIAGKSAVTVLSLGMGAMAFAPDTRVYWLYFLNGALARWGEAGDWEKEPERIYKFNFDPKHQLQR